MRKNRQQQGSYRLPASKFPDFFLTQLKIHWLWLPFRYHIIVTIFCNAWSLIRIISKIQKRYDIATTWKIILHYWPFLSGSERNPPVTCVYLSVNRSLPPPPSGPAGERGETKSSPKESQPEATEGDFQSMGRIRSRWHHPTSVAKGHFPSLPASYEDMSWCVHCIPIISMGTSV